MMHPRRKRRIILLPILCLVIFAITCSSAWFLLYQEKNYARLGDISDNNSVARILAIHLFGAIAPVTAPAISWVFHDYMNPETIRIRKPAPPHIPEPYPHFTHFISGYQIHGKINFETLTLPLDKIPTAMVEKTLTKTGRGINNEYWNIMDSNWSVRVGHAKFGDTIYFRGVLTDYNAVYANLPSIFDSALAVGVIGLHSMPLNRPKSITEGMYDILRIVVFDGKKVIYQRGDTTDCKPIYTAPPDWLPKRNLALTIYRSNQLDWQTKMHSFSRHELFYIYFGFLVLIAVTFFMTYYRGYALPPNKRKMEMEWEREHNGKQGTGNG